MSGKVTMLFIFVWMGEWVRGSVGVSVYACVRACGLTELTRHITPPTKNGHAPPPIESRKSSQSVNPPRVWTW